MRKSATKHSAYTLITAHATSLILNILDYNISSMQYTVSTSTFALPSSGLIRTYTCAI